MVYNNTGTQHADPYQILVWLDLHKFITTLQKCAKKMNGKTVQVKNEK